MNDQRLPLPARDSWQSAIAIALGYWTAPRATLNVAIALDVAPAALPTLLKTLLAAGCDLREDAFERAQFGDFGARFGGIRVDFLLPVLPISIDAMRRNLDSNVSANSFALPDSGA